MTVTWLEARRYHVASRSEPELPHLVDMDEEVYRQCDCKAVMQYKQTTCCWHMKQVLHYEEIITTMVAVGPVGLVLQPADVRLVG